MGFDVFLNAFTGGRSSRIPRGAVKAAFGVWLCEESPSVWRIDYGDRNFCHIYVDDDPADIASIMVSKPVGDRRLWDAVLAVMKLGNVMLYYPGFSAPLVANDTVVAHLPKISEWPPVRVKSGDEILDRIRKD